MEQQDFKEKVLEAVNSMDSISSCFSIVTNGDNNAVCIGGSHKDLVISLASVFSQQPSILELISDAVKLTAAKKLAMPDFLQSAKPFCSKNSCEREEKQEAKHDPEESFESMAKKFMEMMISKMNN